MLSVQYAASMGTSCPVLGPQRIPQRTKVSESSQFAAVKF